MTTTPPSPSPSPVPWTPNSLSKPPVCFSPPLIAMLVIIATAFIIITYSRAISRKFFLLRSRWRQRRRLLRSYDIESPPNSGEQPYDPDYSYGYGYHLFSRYGLDDAVIKTIPLSVHTRKASVHECAVCLLEFEDDDYVRTLPVCFHAFHVECIDIWLKCHANCPLCRSSVFRSDSPFIPVMSARIRPNFDDVILDPSSVTVHSRQRHSITGISDITHDASVSVSVSVSPTSNQFDDRFYRRDLLLKRSYSFGFERNLGTSSTPWRHRRGSSFWCKRPSPTKTRVFSFRYSRRMKSPFFRRRSISFLPVTESSGGSCRRINSGVFSSSRLRSGDPEALLSPDRYNRRLR